MSPATPTAGQHAIRDVGAVGIARVYAVALYNAAAKRQQADAVLQELNSLVHDLFQADPQLEAFLSSDAIGRRRKAAVIERVFQGRCSELFLNFLMVLNEHGRLGLVRAILAAYRQHLDTQARRITVRVQTAAPLPDDQRRRLEAQIRELFHIEPVLDVQVDPAVLGGLIVRVGDWLYDGSVRTRLQTLLNELTASSSHAIQSQRDRFSTPIGN